MTAAPYSSESTPLLAPGLPTRSPARAPGPRAVGAAARPVAAPARASAGFLAPAWVPSAPARAEAPARAPCQASAAPSSKLRRYVLRFRYHFLGPAFAQRQPEHGGGGPRIGQFTRFDRVDRPAVGERV